ncbi:MAG: right-handed parallel beta-helix repeat-containing protein [Phycisphaerae bacterium]|nr:right-handed parallel beta-helix repeat-containing protein [Phycisphaerae bacterium]
MLLTLLGLAFSLRFADPPVTLYLSPTGSDSAAGDTPDRALASLAAARDRLRSIRASQHGVRPGPARIELAPGHYTLSETFTLGPEDSGRPDAPVTYAARVPGTVVISGGSRLPVWKPALLNGRSVWAAALPDAVRLPTDGAPAFRSLWIANQRRTWARYPNAGGFARVEAIPERPPGDWTAGPSSFRFAPADAPAWQAAGIGCEVTTFARWIDSHLRVAALEPETRLARFVTPNVISLDPGDLYFLEGSAALLDEPGEWWCDPVARLVYTIPIPGDAPESESFVPRLDELLRVQGDPAGPDGQAAPVEHITFQGLAFAHARWWFAPDWRGDWPAHKPVGFSQAAAGAPGAVVCEGARHVTFDRCTIRSVEAYGLALGRACSDCRVSACTMTDLGAGGLKIGEPSIRPDADDRAARNRIEDCSITDGGRIHHQAVGVWIGQSPANTLAHNLISEFDYTGISVGWTWGYGPSAAGGNVIEWNEVRSLGARPGGAEPPLGDMAGIYTLGVQSGTVIRNNYFHDIAGRSIAWGIYFDEGSTGILAECNIVLRTTHGSFHQHYGRDNIVRDNLFLNGRDAQLWRTRREDHGSFILERNLILGNSDQWLAGDWSSGFSMSRNLHWRDGGKTPVFPGNRSFDAWQAAGFDAGSLLADPDLQLDPPTRPAFGPRSGAASLGLTLPDLTGVGPRTR